MNELPAKSGITFAITNNFIYFMNIFYFKNGEKGGNILTKFVTLWELDRTRIPDDPEEQFRYWNMLVNMIKEDMKNGRTIDFGMFTGGFEGYVIREGTEQEIQMEISKYSTITNHKTYTILSISQLEEMLKAK